MEERWQTASAQRNAIIEFVDDRFRKLLRNFETEPKNIWSIGRIYLEYQRAGQDPAEFIEERILDVQRRGKNPALWLQIVEIFGIEPATALIIQNLMRRKGRAKILGPDIVGQHLHRVDELAVERIAQLVGGKIMKPSSYTWYIHREGQGPEDLTIVYNNAKFAIGTEEGLDETCDFCQENEHGGCDHGLDEDGDCVCCGVPASCDECSQDNHRECENGLEIVNQTTVCACCNEEIEGEAVFED